MFTHLQNLIQIYTQKSKGTVEIEIVNISDPSESRLHLVFSMDNSASSFYQFVENRFTYYQKITDSEVIKISSRDANPNLRKIQSLASKFSKEASLALQTSPA